MNELTREQKQVIARVGIDLNISAQKIADILGVHRATIYRYAEEPTPEELQQFATEIRGMFYIKQQTVLAEIIKNMEDIASTTNSIRDLAYAFDVLKRNGDGKEREEVERPVPILGSATDPR